jgi:hypothetical protein
MSGRELAKDLVDETPAFRRTPDGGAAGEPPARWTGHEATIPLPGSRSVIKITFPGRVLGMMRAWPLPRVSTATTW